MKPRQRFSISSLVKRLSFFVIFLALLIIPCSVFADSLLLVRIIDSIDLAKLSEIKDLDLSAVVRMDAKGNIVVSCLNLSLPLAHNPFKDNPGMQKFMQRTRLQVDPDAKGVMVKLAFLF
jgi:hypothetical protein